MKWIKVEDGLPNLCENVLVLIERDPYSIAIPPTYYQEVAQLGLQYKTQQPFWVFSRDHVPVEDQDRVVIYWSYLLSLPDEIGKEI